MPFGTGGIIDLNKKRKSVERGFEIARAAQRNETVLSDHRSDLRATISLVEKR